MVCDNTAVSALYKTLTVIWVSCRVPIERHSIEKATYNSIRRIALKTLICGGVFTASVVLAHGVHVTVKRGDTLWGIAKQNGVTIGALQRDNQTKSDTVTLGQTLHILGAKSNTTTTRVAPVSSGGASVRAERVLWPLAGVITTRYSYCGKGCGHAGLDIAAPTGTLIYAAVSGTVTSSGWNVFGYGNLVIVRGAGGRDYYYAHNSSLLVKAGQTVRQGQPIARVGSTGNSSGPHLHFEVRGGGALVNPMAFLPSSQAFQASYRGR